MKAMWKKYADKFDAMSVRERLMVFGAAVIVAIYLVFALFIEPAQKREKLLAGQMQQQQADLKTLRQQIQMLEQRLADPDAAARTRRDGLKRQIAEIDESLKGVQKSLVPAQRMNALLHDMLARNPRLRLIGMRSLPLSTLVERRDKTPDAGGAAAADRQMLSEGNVFKHGVEVTLSGSYADLHDYLARLERLPWRMFWSRATLNAADYPRITLAVTIYTLSLDKAWLEV
ncbi:MAG: type II secretion system protein M [Betaproteobacteria bacterium]|nr:type II secretion system protein M [Betaproteobacteria bacterium]